LLAQPSVQLVRFGTKAALAWFLVPADYGAVALAGLLAYLASHVALLGLNEALIQAEEIGGDLWGRLRRLHHRAGVAVSGVQAAVGVVVSWLADDPTTGHFIIVLAPMVWVANLATLPTALLVREQSYARLFRIDVCSALALGLSTLGLAALGAGPWSVAAGLYANAVVASLLALREARPFLPKGTVGDATGDDVVQRGVHFCKAELLSISGEQVDSLAVGFFVGQAALGLYSYALMIAQVLMNYTTSLAERSLFPILADRQRRDSLGPSFSEAVRVSILFMLPLHAVLAVVSDPLTTLIFPEAWEGVGDLLLLLSLASGARCLDIVGTTALKARGEGRQVARLGILRLGVLALALSASLPFDVYAVAAAVLAARGLAAGITMNVARRLIDPAPSAALATGSRVVVAWGVVYPLTAVASANALRAHPVVEIGASLLLAIVWWLGLRAVLDRASFKQDCLMLTRRLGRQAS